MKAATINGVSPDLRDDRRRQLPVARPLFFYIKNAHRGVIPGLDEFVTEYVSEESFGEGGYLSERGLIPLPAEEREATRQAVASSAHLDRFN